MRLFINTPTDETAVVYDGAKKDSSDLYQVKSFGPYLLSPRQGDGRISIRLGQKIQNAVGQASILRVHIAQITSTYIFDPQIQAFRTFLLVWGGVREEKRDWFGRVVKSPCPACLCVKLLSSN